FSLFGPSILTRLVTQMYFPGDPLLELDPIFNGVPEASRQLLVSKLSIELSEPEWALGYEFNIVLRGRAATPLED
ncbi:MAG: protocatechuate 3,4-dioxygenase subunit beta, partial [Rhodospirillaceae bacterium]|nr:protocatechuate 3,4-dioxygenase subunit beta [Rhodospirillaceae bacterium]